MNLYLLTNLLGNYYVIAETPNDAKDSLESLLHEASYGYYSHRKVTKIELISEEVQKLNANGHPNFSSGNTLILPTTCK